MVQEMAPVRCRLVAHGKMARRKRIFARLREGSSYEEIGAEEGVTATRIRQIVSEVLQKRSVDCGADHAKLQLDRLLSPMQLAKAIAAGDVTAISPYLKVLDRLDRYQTVASAHQAYDGDARKKLMDKINRMAANYGVDEVIWAAAEAHLKKQGVTQDEPSAADAVEDPTGLGEADAVEAPAGAVEEPQESQSEAANWMSV
jgi:uncharacterized protein YerC